MNKINVPTLIIISLMLLSVALIKPANASRTLTVPDNYSTIQDAIKAATTGDTVFVRNGMYNEELVIDKPITLKGEDRENAIINSGNSGPALLVSKDNVEITGFTVQNNSTNKSYPYWYWSSGKAAIHLLSVKYCNIHGNKVIGRGCGIWLYDSHQNNVFDNIVQACDYGITVQSSTYNTLLENSVTNNSYGLSLFSSSNNNFKNNSVHGNSQNLAITGNSISEYVNNMDQSNLVGGKPTIYWVDITGKSVPSDVACVILVNCREVTVNGLNLNTNNQAGVTLAGTQNCLIINNNITNQETGIITYNSQWDIIDSNNIHTSEGIKSNGNSTQIINNTITAGTGISIGGYYQKIVGNTIDSQETGDYTITCSGSYNNITQNTLKSAMRGLILTGPSNLLYGNTITNCWEILVKSDSNIIANNTITACTITVDYAAKNIICTNTITQTGTAINLVFAKDNTFYANDITKNRVAVEIGSDVEHLSGNRFYHNNFIDNDRQVGENWAKNTANFWDNGKEGNYWSDYNLTGKSNATIIYIPYQITSFYHDPAKETDYNFICGKDNFPLMRPYTISTAIIELPEWNDPAKPPTSILPQNPTLIKPSSTLQPDPLSQPLPTATIAAILVPTAIAIGAIVYLKKKNSHKTTTNNL